MSLKASYLYMSPENRERVEGKMMELQVKEPCMSNVQEAFMNEYWDERSSSYSDMNMRQFYSSRREAWENAIFSHVREDRSLKVLDIGTGPGFFAILSALRGHDVTAVDMTGNMLRQASHNARMAGAKVRFEQVGHRLLFPKESFDLILSRDVTWTLTDPKTQLRDWFDLLKPGGKMLYFDADWNYHLKNRENFEEWKQIKQSIENEGIVFYPKAGILDEVAVTLPMTHEDRPLWDQKFWSREGRSCRIYKNLNPYIFNREEQIHYKAHPVFLVEVTRD